MKDHILSEILFNEKIVTEIAELVLTGRRNYNLYIYLIKKYLSNGGM
jgi:hypothetical protein